MTDHRVQINIVFDIGTESTNVVLTDLSAPDVLRNLDYAINEAALSEAGSMFIQIEREDGSQTLHRADMIRSVLVRRIGVR